MTEKDETLNLEWDIEENPDLVEIGVPNLPNLDLKLDEEPEEEEKVEKEKETETEEETLSKEEEEKAVEEVIEEEREEEKEEKSEIDTSETFKILAEDLSEKGIVEMPENFDGSEESFVELFENRIEQQVEQRIAAFKQSFNEEGQELIEHIRNGGRVADFKDAHSYPDFKDLDIENDEAAAKYVIRENLRVKGFSESEIDEELEVYEENELIHKRAKSAKNFLVKHTDTIKKQLEDKIKAEKEAQEIRREEVITEIGNIVNKSPDINGFPIGAKAKSELIEYMTIPKVSFKLPNGETKKLTQFQADEYKASENIEDLVLKAYLRMTNYDTSKLTKKKVSENNKKLSERLNNLSMKTDTMAKTKASSSRQKDDDIWGNI